MDRMNKMRDLEKQAATPEQKPKDDWRKKALYNIQQNSEAAQKRTSSSSDRDLELGANTGLRSLVQNSDKQSSHYVIVENPVGETDVALTLTNRRQRARKRRWQENRSVSGGAAASSESQIHRYRRQDSEAGSGHNDANSSTRQLGKRKGWSSEAIDHFARWHKGESEDPYLDLVRCQQEQYIQNNYHKDES